MDLGENLHHPEASTNNMHVPQAQSDLVSYKVTKYKDFEKLLQFTTNCFIDGQPMGCNVVKIYSKKLGEADLFMYKRKGFAMIAVNLQNIKCNVLFTENCFKFYDAQKRHCKISLENSLKLRNFADALCKAGVFVERSRKLRRAAIERERTNTDLSLPAVETTESNVTETTIMKKRSKKVTFVTSPRPTKVSHKVAKATACSELPQNVTSQNVTTQTPAGKRMPSVDSDINTMEAIQDKIQILAKLTQLPHLCIQDLHMPETTDSLDEEKWTKLLQIETFCFLCREYFGRVNVVVSSSNLGTTDLLLDKDGKFLLRLLLGQQNVTLNQDFIKFRDEEHRWWRLYFQCHNDQQRFLETLRKLGQYVDFGLEPNNITKSNTSELLPSSNPKELLKKHEDRLALDNEMQQIMLSMSQSYEKAPKANTIDEDMLELDKEFINRVMESQMLLRGHEAMDEVLNKYRRPSACLHCKTLLRHNNELKDFSSGIKQKLDQAAMTMEVQNQRILGLKRGLKQLAEHKRKMLEDAL